MNISQKKARAAINPWPWRSHPHGYVVPESEIRELVGNQLLKNLNDFAARMQVIVEATTCTYSAAHFREVATLAKDRLTEGDIRMIRRVAGQDRSRQYQRLMKAILDAIEHGPEGIRAVRRSAALAVRLAFAWSSTYNSALLEYENDLAASRARG
jgi:hypothetical protein